ncbi:hypothetical protein EDC01DRAFT_630672 [Geopyxis carbonaria]|nr:hypothetical protein EDC01DRAFT_630672 [Geopyxis carbonaria]
MPSNKQYTRHYDNKSKRKYSSSTVLSDIDPPHQASKRHAKGKKRSATPSRGHEEYPDADLLRRAAAIEKLPKHEFRALVRDLMPKKPYHSDERYAEMLQELEDGLMTEEEAIAAGYPLREKSAWEKDDYNDKHSLLPNAAQMYLSWMPEGHFPAAEVPDSTLEDGPVDLDYLRSNWPRLQLNGHETVRSAQAKVAAYNARCGPKSKRAPIRLPRNFWITKPKTRSPSPEQKQTTAELEAKRQLLNAQVRTWRMNAKIRQARYRERKDRHDYQTCPPFCNCAETAETRAEWRHKAIASGYARATGWSKEKIEKVENEWRTFVSGGLPTPDESSESLEFASDSEHGETSVLVYEDPGMMEGVEYDVNDNMQTEED